MTRPFFIARNDRPRWAAEYCAAARSPSTPASTANSEAGWAIKEPISANPPARKAARRETGRTGSRSCGPFIGLVSVRWRLFALLRLALRADAENFQQVGYLRIAHLARHALQSIGHTHVERLRLVAGPAHDVMVMMLA